MSDNLPLVSIALITYQNARYLGECLDSIQGQTYSRIEIIVADDGSTDQSTDLIQAYAAKDKRIKPLLHSCNRGIGFNLNSAIDACTGSYICIIAGDDRMYPDKIARQVEFLESHPDYAICLHDVDVFNDDKKQVVYRWLDRYRSPEKAEQALFLANWHTLKDPVYKSPSGSWFGRATYIRDGRNDERTHSFHEFIFILGMHVKNPGARWGIIPDVLGLYRVHGSSLSQSKGGFLKMAEEITVCYNLAQVKFPAYSKAIFDEEAYWWFMNLLYKMIPENDYRLYRKEFRRRFGWRRSVYLSFCVFYLRYLSAPRRMLLGKTV